MPRLSFPQPARTLGRIILKALGLFVAFNLGYVALNPLPALGQLSAYNSIFPGRSRLPFGETPDKAYNFSTFSLEAMFASHEVNQSKGQNEYRVLVVGDSSVWGTLLHPDETLTGALNRLALVTPDGRRLRTYNLGYPTISLAKDLIILSRLHRYQPDAILWLTTLEAFPKDKQLDSPILQHNPDAVRPLITRYNLSLDPHDPGFIASGFWQRTLFGQRRDLADLIRLQVYGAAWAATGIDQYYPPTFEPRANDQATDPTFHNLQPPHLPPDALSMDVLQAGMTLYPDIPILLVNEPMFISDGKNSDIRYNFYYPRWAYADYRTLLADLAARQDWHYLDMWDTIAPTEFTNSAIHLTPAGEDQLATLIGPALLNLARPK